MAFSPDNQWLAIAAKGRVSLRDVNSGNERISYAGGNRFLAFSPSGDLLASCNENGQVVLFRIDTGLTDLNGLPASKVAFSPDEKTLVLSRTYDGFIDLWDVANSRVRRRFKASPGGVSDFALSPTGKLLATVGNDGIVKIWTMDSGAETTGLAMRQPGAGFVEFSRDGAMLAVITTEGTGAQDENVWLWHVIAATERCPTVDEEKHGR